MLNFDRLGNIEENTLYGLLNSNNGLDFQDFWIQYPYGNFSFLHEKRGEKKENICAFLQNSVKISLSHEIWGCSGLDKIIINNTTTNNNKNDQPCICIGSETHGTKLILMLTLSWMRRVKHRAIWTLIQTLSAIDKICS